jgi:hypothetical protein
MTKKFEDFLFTVDQPSVSLDHVKIQKFSEYRKGSHEYGQLFQDLMMLLRLKKEEDKDSDTIILNKEDLKSLDRNKLVKLLSDKKKMRKLGMSFDVEMLGNGSIQFSNLGNKESRPWENIDIK